MTDTQDAIERAQAWLRESNERGGEYYLPTRKAYKAMVPLAALGSASVGLAAALQARKHGGACTPGKCDQCDALAEWAQRVQDGAEPH